MHCLIGLITGHVALNRHRKLIGVKDGSICPLCSEEEETMLHFLGQCPALANIRQRILGMDPLIAHELGKVRFFNLIRFAHSSGRFRMRIGPNRGLSAGQGPPRRKGKVPIPVGFPWNSLSHAHLYCCPTSSATVLNGRQTQHSNKSIVSFFAVLTFKCVWQRSWLAYAS